MNKKTKKIIYMQNHTDPDGAVWIFFNEKGEELGSLPRSVSGKEEDGYTVKSGTEKGLKLYGKDVEIKPIGSGKFAVKPLFY